MHLYKVDTGLINLNGAYSNCRPHLDRDQLLVPVFLHSFYLLLTHYKMDISLRWTPNAGPKGVHLRGSALVNIRKKALSPLMIFYTS